MSIIQMLGTLAQNPSTNPSNPLRAPLDPGGTEAPATPQMSLPQQLLSQFGGGADAPTPPPQGSSLPPWLQRLAQSGGMPDPSGYFSIMQKRDLNAPYFAARAAASARAQALDQHQADKEQAMMMPFIQAAIKQQEAAQRSKADAAGIAAFQQALSKGGEEGLLEAEMLLPRLSNEGMSDKLTTQLGTVLERQRTRLAVRGLLSPGTINAAPTPLSAPSASAPTSEDPFARFPGGQRGDPYAGLPRGIPGPAAPSPPGAPALATVPTPGAGATDDPFAGYPLIRRAVDLGLVNASQAIDKIREDKARQNANEVPHTDKEGNTYLINRETGTQRLLTRGTGEVMSPGQQKVVMGPDGKLVSTYTVPLAEGTLSAKVFAPKIREDLQAAGFDDEALAKGTMSSDPKTVAAAWSTVKATRDRLKAEDAAKVVAEAVARANAMKNADLDRPLFQNPDFKGRVVYDTGTLQRVPGADKMTGRQYLAGNTTLVSAQDSQVIDMANRDVQFVNAAEALSKELLSTVGYGVNLGNALKLMTAKYGATDPRVAAFNSLQSLASIAATRVETGTTRPAVQLLDRVEKHQLDLNKDTVGTAGAKLPILRESLKDLARVKMGLPLKAEEAGTATLSTEISPGVFIRRGH